MLLWRCQCHFFYFFFGVSLFPGTFLASEAMSDMFPCLILQLALGTLGQIYLQEQPNAPLPGKCLRPFSFCSLAFYKDLQEMLGACPSVSLVADLLWIVQGSPSCLRPHSKQLVFLHFYLKDDLNSFLHKHSIWSFRLLSHELDWHRCSYRVGIQSVCLQDPCQFMQELVMMPPRPCISKQIAVNQNSSKQQMAKSL